MSGEAAFPVAESQEATPATGGLAESCEGVPDEDPVLTLDLDNSPMKSPLAADDFGANSPGAETDFQWGQHEACERGVCALDQTETLTSTQV